MLDNEMRAYLDRWIQFLSEKGSTLSPERFQEVAAHISDIEAEKTRDKKDVDAFQKEVEDEEKNKKAKTSADPEGEDKAEIKRMYAPSKTFKSIVDLMEHASILRYSPPSGFSGMEPGGGHTAGGMYPGTEPLQNPSASMFSVINGSPVGNGPEAHTGDQGAQEGNNITLEVWPQGFVNLLIGGKPSGSATIGGMVTGERAAEASSVFKDGEEEVPVKPYRVDITADDVRALMDMADQGLEYRRQLEFDGVRYVIARDQALAQPDMHLRVMRSIKDIKTLKDYVNNLRESAEAKYRTNPESMKSFKDFLRIPERQTTAPAAGLGNRNIKLPDDKRADLTSNPDLYRA